MFRPHISICKCHGLKRLIVVKSGLCKIGNDEKKKEKEAIIKTRIGIGTRKTKKTTGELHLFKEIYEERGPQSQISGQWVAFSPWIMSHILSKGAYPGFRLNKKNIVIKTPEEHQSWETQRHKLKDKPEWAWIFELEQELKEEYYDKTKRAGN